MCAAPPLGQERRFLKKLGTFFNLGTIFNFYSTGGGKNSWMAHAPGVHKVCVVKPGVVACSERQNKGFSRPFSLLFASLPS